jgi:hypothetical protein
MNLTHRKQCIMCKGELETIYKLNKFPIYMGVSTPNVEDKYSDKVFATCKDCGCIQLEKLIPLDILYNKSHNSAIGKVWEQHHNQFCDFVKNYTYGNIVEIGGGNLKVANTLAKNKAVKKITVFDKFFPFDKKSDKIVLQNTFFDSNLVYEKLDGIIHTHLIEHLYNPLEQIKEIADNLKEGALMMFASPLIDEMLKDNYTNAMNFEHTFLISEKMVNNILNHAGMEFVSKKYFSKYSAFFIFRKNMNLDFKISHDYSNDFNIIKGFFDFHEKEVEKIKSQIDTDRNNTFIFGAHIFTQYLLGFGLSEDLFLNILDNDPAKQNNKMYGSKLEVKSPKILKDIEKPLVVLKAAMYTEEIKKDILENINPNTRFIL